MASTAPWERRLVASMVLSKQAGYSFQVASKLALLENPPRSEVEKAVVGEVMRFAEDAWMGRRPALKGFSLEMLRGFDGTKTARTGRTRETVHVA